MSPRVLVCDHLEEIGVEKLRAHGFEVVENSGISAEKLLIEASEYDALIVRGRTKITKEVLSVGKRLKVVARAGVGLDNIDLDAAKALGITIISTPTAPTVSVAELVVGLMLSTLRQIALADRAMKSGKWIKSQLRGRELRGKTVGVVGAGGRIGLEVARIVMQGFGCNVVGYDVIDISQKAVQHGFQAASNLEELLRSSEIITIHVPYLPSTHHLLNKERLDAMKNGAILINTSRADIVDGKALLQALKQGKLSGAGLDVFHTEPPSEEWEKALVALQDGGTVCTCHIGAQTEEAQKLESELVADELTKIFSR